MTRYFQEQVKRKRPEIKLAWCVKAIQSPIRRVKQEDRRIRHWILIPEVGKYLRVITLEDGETIHNAFFDRDFEEGSE